MRVNSADELATVLKDSRKRQGLSQATVGESVGLKQTTVSSFEHKAANSRLDTLFRLLSALDLELEVVSKARVIKQELEW